MLLKRSESRRPASDGRSLGTSGCQAIGFSDPPSDTKTDPLLIDEDEAWIHQRVTVVEPPIEDGRGEDLVAKHGAPLRHDLIGCDQHAAALIAARHQLKEEMGAAPLERQPGAAIDSSAAGTPEARIVRGV